MTSSASPLHLSCGRSHGAEDILDSCKEKVVLLASLGEMTEEGELSLAICPNRHRRGKLCSQLQMPSARSSTEVASVGTAAGLPRKGVLSTSWNARQGGPYGPM